MTLSEKQPSWDAALDATVRTDLADFASRL